MGRIIVIPNSDFSRNRIVKKTIDSQTPTTYSSSTEYITKNNDQ